MILPDPFELVRFLGKGKSGYSYLVKNDGRLCVLKQMHDEPCPYYNFTDKFGSELKAYERLKQLGVMVPELLDYNTSSQYLIKEYVDGPTGSELVAQGAVDDHIVSELFSFHRKLSSNGLNIDYFPSNFVSGSGTLYYVDYEINPYIEEWDLLNWGIYYWANSQGMAEFLLTGNASAINESHDKGIPHKAAFECLVSRWKNRFL